MLKNCFKLFLKIIPIGKYDKFRYSLPSNILMNRKLHLIPNEIPTNQKMFNISIFIYSNLRLNCNRILICALFFSELYVPLCIPTIFKLRFFPCQTFCSIMTTVAVNLIGQDVS